MKIEIWSDFICPFCYIGKRKMELALDQFPHKDSVKVYYKSYELDSGSENNPDMSIHALLAQKHGKSIQKAQEMNEHIKQQAKEVGLKYHFDTLQYTNTFDAHRLVQYANKQGKGNALTEALLHAHFTDSKDLSDHATLMEIASRVDLSQDKVLEILESRKFRQHVRDDEEQAEQIGIEAVPYFVFNETYGVSGSHPVNVLLEVLEKVQEEEEEDPLIQSLSQSETSYCTGDGCKINPNKET